MASTSTKKIEKMYGALGPKEVRRLMAKLAREHNIDEMNRLRLGISSEQASTYNDGLKLLRVLNGNLLDWILIAGMGMERERHRLNTAFAEGARQWLESYRMGETWRLIPYPVTESEYRAIVKLQRARAEPIEEWIGSVWEKEPETPGLRPELADILRERPPYDDESDEAEEREEELWQRFYQIVIDAIERGELRKAKRPSDTTSKSDGYWVASGALSDWALGTTEETHEPFGPGFSIPLIDELFAGSMYAKWEIRPDSDAEQVKARREEIRDVFSRLTVLGNRGRDELPSLEPPLTPQAHRKAQKEAHELYESLQEDNKPAKLAVAAANGFAAFRAQLEGLSGAVDIITRDEFYGEDPLWPEVRIHLEAGREEVERFEDAWNDTSMMNYAIRQEMGLPTETLEEIRETAPIPTIEPETQEMLSLIRAWGES